LKQGQDVPSFLMFQPVSIGRPQEDSITDITLRRRPFPGLDQPRKRALDKQCSSLTLSLSLSLTAGDSIKANK